jgi:hypothetical protein
MATEHANMVTAHANMASAHVNMESERADTAPVQANMASAHLIWRQNTPTSERSSENDLVHPVGDCVSNVAGEVIKGAEAQENNLRRPGT